MNRLLQVTLLLALFAQVCFCETREDLIRFDYSRIFMNGDLIGYIGDGQRLYMHFDRIYKDQVNPLFYNIEGKSRVKQNICNFKGKIEIDSIIRRPDDCHLVERYKLSAKYLLREDSTQRGTGIFKGQLSSCFFVYNDSVYFDDLEGGMDGYHNNQFEGVWRSYRVNVKKKANFGIDRIPDSQNLDIGADEFRVNRSKITLGWRTFYLYQNAKGDEYQAASAEEQREWWKTNHETVVTWTSKTKGNSVLVDILRNSKYLQTIKLNSPNQNYLVSLEDYNFDGYRDIAISHGDSDSLHLYLWSPTQGKYVEQPSFEKIKNPSLDKDNQCIVGNQFLDDNNIEYNLYKFENNRFLLISTIIKEAWANNYKKMTEYDLDGKIKNRKENLTYSQLCEFWRSFFLIDYIIENCY